MPWTPEIPRAAKELVNAWPYISSSTLTPQILQSLIGIAALETGLIPPRPFNYGNITVYGAQATNCPTGSGTISNLPMCFRDYPDATSGWKDMFDTIVHHKLHDGHESRAVFGLVSGDTYALAAGMAEAGYYIDASKPIAPQIKFYADNVYGAGRLVAKFTGQPFLLYQGPGVTSETPPYGTDLPPLGTPNPLNPGDKLPLPTASSSKAKTALSVLSVGGTIAFTAWWFLKRKTKVSVKLCTACNVYPATATVGSWPVCQNCHGKTVVGAVPKEIMYLHGHPVKMILVGVMTNIVSLWVVEKVKKRKR